MERKFIESSEFPLDLVNQASTKEKGSGRPDHWEMVFWWTRKPLASARAVIAGALLPYGIERSRFKTWLRLDSEKSPHRLNPTIPQDIFDKYFKDKKVLDPFAGFGSIPLEALRLGVKEVVAVELLPTAYVFLKAVLEYPKFAVEQGLGKGLIKDVEAWGNWILNKLKEDPEIKELYDEDVAVYIGAWEVKCPACGKYSPMIGNWWLARVKDKGRYAWIDWNEEHEEIIVKDLNKELKQKAVKPEEVSESKVRVREITYKIKEKNIEPRSETATCLHCKVEINHRVVNTELIRPGKGDKSKGVWYLKHAIKEWNENLEKYLNGEISLQQLLKSAARPKVFVRVKSVNEDLYFEPAKQEDNEKLWKALEKLKQIWGDPDIPTELFAPYQMGTAGALRITLWGFDKFYKLFNPRQLLTLVKLVKLIREAGKRVEEEKLREGWSKEEAYRYAEAVTTYLAIALVNFSDNFSLTTYWENTWLMLKRTMAFRGIAMTWNWCDANPVYNITGSWVRSLDNVSEGLSYLVSAVSGSPSRVRVLLDDATVLSKLSGEKFDVIVTDPPYADDVPYAELSDFYYVWLKRALSDVEGDNLRPRFLSEAFFDEFGVEIRTQWEVYAKREISDNEGRREYFGLSRDFSDLLAEAFANVLQYLDSNGVLVTYYVAKKEEAWVSLIDALWRRLGLVISAAYPIQTELEESVIARGKSSVLGGFVIVWRKTEGSSSYDVVDLASSEDRVKLVNFVANEFEKYSQFRKYFFIFSFIAGLSTLLRFREVRYGGITLSTENVVIAASSIGFEGSLKSVGVDVKDPHALAYLLLKLASKDGSISSDELSYVTYATGLSDSEMIKAGLITPVESGGPKVSKRRTYVVIMPKNTTATEFVSALSKVRGKSRILEAFREIQIGALTPSFKFESVKVKYGDVINEVLTLCMALTELAKREVLSIEDPDVKTAQAILNVRLKLV
ncbi:MAG: DNA methylase [Zestosphaera tikiterensis]|uniref:DNA methylase n=1 Tax=Zestosphaera tikiterensis TaxID=1973259 RepID=A0A2R7Y6H4_9CREN|nr:MAG: DNA methylase [Zestosphaera tikiterensis]